MIAGTPGAFRDRFFTFSLQQWNHLVMLLFELSFIHGIETARIKRVEHERRFPRRRMHRFSHRDRLFDQIVR